MLAAWLRSLYPHSQNPQGNYVPLFVFARSSVALFHAHSRIQRAVTGQVLLCRAIKSLNSRLIAHLVDSLRYYSPRRPIGLFSFFLVKVQILSLSYNGDARRNRLQLVEPPLGQHPGVYCFFFWGTAVLSALTSRKWYPTIRTIAALPRKMASL